DLEISSPSYWVSIKVFWDCPSEQLAKASIPIVIEVSSMFFI
ncbi:MAG: hypothetical protein ACI9HG_002075, partial [Flavobacteriales bacterium]